MTVDVAVSQRDGIGGLCGSINVSCRQTAMEGCRPLYTPRYGDFFLSICMLVLSIERYALFGLSLENT
jgi:hypothetical protein